MKAIVKALLEAQKEMGNATKDSKNPFFKSKYADLNSIREACMPVLNKHGIIVLQPTIYHEGKNFINTILLHESGERIDGLTEIIYSKQNDAQAQGSGITYARRYGLQSLVNVGAEDDDGNKASVKVKEELASTTQISIIEGMLNEVNLTDKQLNTIENELSSYTSERATECIEWLKTKTIDRIDSELDYTQTDIKNKLKQL